MLAATRYVVLDNDRPALLADVEEMRDHSAQALAATDA